MSPYRVSSCDLPDSHPLASVRGRVLFFDARDQPGFGAFVYLPLGRIDPTRTTLLVHGITRNAAEQAARFAPLAERVGSVLVAPLFSRALFPRYQTLGRRRGQPDPVAALEALLSSLGATLSIDTRRLHAFGFSGGGQFLHRFAMTQPQRFVRLVVGAAGWYTFPDASVEFPEGVASWPAWTSANADAFLALPLQVLVGKRDSRRDPSLNTRASIDHRQGKTRLARARRWVDALQTEAARRGRQGGASLRMLDKVSHDFSEAVATRGYAESVFSFLFPSEPTSEP